MKKQTLVLLAGGLLTFAACTNDQATGGYTQEQLDSAVNARVTEIQAQLQASNDSAINALAQIKADSMLAAMKGGGSVTRSTTTKTTTPATSTTTTTTTTTPPRTVGNGKPDMKGEKGDGTIGNGKPRMGGEKKDDGTIGDGKPKMK